MSRPPLMLVAEVDQSELMCRIAEGGLDIERPEGMSAKEALEEIEPETREILRRMANAAMEYFAECFQRAAKNASPLQ